MSAPLRIAIDAREIASPVTGVGRYLLDLIRHWPDADRIDLYVREPPLALPLSAARLEVHVLPSRRKSGLWWQYKVLPEAIGSTASDVFFSPAYSTPGQMSLPQVVTVHDLSFISIPHDFTLREGLRRRLTVTQSIDSARGIIAVSDFTAREIAHWFPSAAARVHVIPHGSPTVHEQPASRRSSGRERTGPLILTVGSIFNRRRLPSLLEAVRLLTPQRPALRLDVVGANRTEPRIDWSEQVRGSGLEGHVVLEGFMSDEMLDARYVAADLAVYLSDYEGFGLPVLEAMARGLPVVISDRPALNEIFGSAAAVVDPDHPRAIAAAITRLLDDPVARASHIERGLDLARRHSWTRAAASTRSLLEQVARER